MARAANIILKSFKVDSNGVDPVKGLPERLKVFNWGRNETLKGPVIIDKDSLAVFESNQKRLGRETCAIDFNHGTVEGSEAWKAAKGNPDIAGYFQPRIVEGEGLYLENVSTTPTGLAKAADFKDLSPTPLVDESTNRLIGLHSVALTPTGAVPELTIANAQLKAMSAAFVTLSVSILDQSSKNQLTPRAYTGQTDYSKLQDYQNAMTDENMKSLRTALGMPDDADWDKIFPAVMAKIGAGKEGPITTNASNQTPTWTSSMDYKVMQAEIQKGFADLLKPLSAELESVKGQLAANRADAEKQAKDDLIVQATKAGKAITLSADRISKLDVESLRDVIAQIPSNTVPTRTTMMVLNAEPPKDKRTMRNAADSINQQITNDFGPGIVKVNRN